MKKIGEKQQGVSNPKRTDIEVIPVNIPKPAEKPIEVTVPERDYVSVPRKAS